MSEIERKLIVDEADRKFSFVTVQDVEPILDSNKELRTQEQRSDFMRHSHRVPLNVINQWIAEEHERGNVLRFGSEECDLFIYKKLQDPSNFEFKVGGPTLRTGWGTN